MPSDPTTLITALLLAVKAEITRNTLAEYIVALIMAIGGAALLLIARAWISGRMREWIARVGRYGRVDRKLTIQLVRSVLALLLLLPFYWAFDSLTFSKGLTKGVKFVFFLLFTFGTVRVLANLTGFLIDTMLRDHKNGSAGAAALMPIVRTIVWAIGLTFLLDNLGFQISSIVAGLGIMGVAVGLAGQAILADFFSYLVILLDRPFALGDNVRFGAVSGTIESIGIKTTRIRSGTGELVICPNGDVTKQVVSNFQPVRNRTRVFTFGVAYETPLAKVRGIPSMVRQCAATVEGMEINRAHFTALGDFSLNFEVSFSMAVRDLPPLLDAQELLLLALMERFEQEEIGFAYPTQTLHIAGEQIRA